MKWYQGNLHCHSTNSDGNASPKEVAAYYQSLGYDFLGISDHNALTQQEEYAVSNDGKLLIIPCSEYTAAHYCHVQGINVSRKIEPEGTAVEEGSKVQRIQDGVDKAIAAGGLAAINHPLWHWTLTEKEMMQINNCHLFELCNAAPDCNSFPISGASFAEQIWDKLLSAGYRYYGLAADDGHYYTPPFSTLQSLGGRGWIMVQAEALTRENIIQSIKNGDFYASTGILLSDYVVNHQRIDIAIKPFAEEKVCFTFIGKEGMVLQENIGQQADYQINGNEGYIRIRLRSTTGTWAWTQPVFIPLPSIAG